MGDLKAKCGICLSSVQDATKLGSPELENESLMGKLENVVPEVEWCEDYTICEICTAAVNSAYNFRLLCIELDSERRSALASDVKCEEDPLHIDSELKTEVLAEHNYADSDESKAAEPTPAKKFQCGTCKYSYANRKNLRVHLKKCQVKPCPKRYRFSCQVCDLVLKSAKLLTEHCVSEHALDKKAVRPYSCDECPGRFATSTTLTQHQKQHSENRDYICSFCGKAYKRQSDIIVHEYSHFNRRNYKCQFCPKTFNANKTLKSHILVHTDSSLWKFTCEQCNRKFSKRYTYNQHMRRHTGEKPHGCHLCTKSFVTKGELQKHIEFHSSVKPFKCEHCDKEYKNKWMYKVHLTKTHGIGNMKVPVKKRKFQCHVCPSAFCDRLKLERHLRKHEREALCAKVAKQECE